MREHKVDEEEREQELRRQQKMIREFEAKHYEVASNGMEPVVKLGIIFFEVLITMILCIPFTMEDIKIFGMIALTLAPWPVLIYMNRYLIVMEDGKAYRIAEKLRYLPVERKALWRVHFEYLICFLRLPFLCGMAAQLLVAAIANHRITLGNVLCPFLVAGVYPFLIGLGLIHERK